MLHVGFSTNQNQQSEKPGFLCQSGKCLKQNSLQLTTYSFLVHALGQNED